MLHFELFHNTAAFCFGAVIDPYGLAAVHEREIILVEELMAFLYAHFHGAAF